MNSNLPLLSVIIPCYNCTETLEEAVLSCYAQGFLDSEFEVVLVDDCSTDNTRTCIESLHSAHPNIRFVAHDKNRGGGATRNTAVRSATAPVIFCLDSDDILPDNTLRKMYDFLQQKKADGVGLHHSTKFRGNNVADIVYRDTFSYANERIPLDSLLQLNNIKCSLYSVFMFTKTAWERCGGYPEHHGFDTQGFAWRFLCSGLCAYTCPDTDYLHRVAFNHSYYLREDAAGRRNINWQNILLECRTMLQPQVITWIEQFPVQDFTRDLLSELTKRHHDVFVKSDAQIFVLHTPSQLPEAIPRSSWRGWLLRLRARLRSSHI